MQITPAERIKIEHLMSRLELKRVPSDTNVMAWVLPMLEAVVDRYMLLEKRILELEIEAKLRE
jgi:hypothetical protein